MIDKIQKLFKIKIKRNNLKTFLFFLLFATVIWILVQFSKTYTRTVEIPIEYINEPLDKIILEENPQSLGIRTTDNGFGILYYRVFTPTLEVDLDDTEQRAGQLIYKTENHREYIKDQININYNKSEILNKELVIDYHQKMVKKVPVVPNFSVEYKVGYGSPDLVEIKPDSITVSGRKQAVDTLNSVQTIPVELNNINQSVRGEVKINTRNLEGISLYQNKVSYFLEVEKFTEGRVTVPIEVVNVPNGIDISIFPQDIIVIFQVNLDDYSKVNANDFRVACDFKNVDQNENFLIPKIESQPDFVKNVRLSEKKVEYVIKR